MKGFILYFCSPSVLYYAEVAHLVEHDLAKVGVAGSSPVFRSKKVLLPTAEDFFWYQKSLRALLPDALVVELVDTQDLKSCGQQWPCGFNSRLGHKSDQFDRSFFWGQFSFQALMPCRNTCKNCFAYGCRITIVMVPAGQPDCFEIFRCQLVQGKIVFIVTKQQQHIF